MAGQVLKSIDYAERLGVTDEYIAKLKREGRLAVTEDGRIDVDASDRKLADSINWSLEIDRPGKVASALHRLGIVRMPGALPDDPSAIEYKPPEIAVCLTKAADAPVPAAEVAQTAASASDATQLPLEGAKVKDSMTLGALTMARLERERAEADMANLRLMAQLRLVTPVADVEREIGAAFRAIKESLLALPDRLASVLAAEYDEARIHALLNTEIRSALNGIANRARARAADPEEDGEGADAHLETA